MDWICLWTDLSETPGMTKYRPGAEQGPSLLNKASVVRASGTTGDYEKIRPNWIRILVTPKWRMDHSCRSSIDLAISWVDLRTRFYLLPHKNRPSWWRIISFTVSLSPLFQPHFCIDRFVAVSCADRVCTLLACTVNGTARAASVRYCSGYCGIETINQHGDNSAIDKFFDRLAFKCFFIESTHLHIKEWIIRVQCHALKF
jgi:hypothetical protein